MDWKDKVHHLLEGRTKRHIEKVAGLKPNVLSATLSRDSIPNAATGVQVARALGVTTEWLFDDDLGLDVLPSHRLTKLAEDARLAEIARSLPLQQGMLRAEGQAPGDSSR